MTTHTVRRGETLFSIAKLYSTTVDVLANHNHLQTKNILRRGQVLQIPPMRIFNAPNAKLPPNHPAPPAKTHEEKSMYELAQNTVASITHFGHEILEALLQRLRVAEANEHVHHTENIKLTKQEKPVAYAQQPAKKKGSIGSQKVDDVKAKLKEQLGKEPHVIVMNGIKLTENEKKQIMASVAVCEMNKDGFGSINADQEFVGRKFGARGIETQTYSRIVHIGLSYGVIQFTQDSGTLGRVLEKMRTKNTVKFTQIFGGGFKDIADSLITLTTTGHPDLSSSDKVPLSGQVYWGKIRNTDQGKEIKKLANEDKDKDGKSDLPVSREIRGKRVQPIPASPNEVSTDIWTGIWKQRFLDAGQVTDFQEAQLEFAVDEYMNPILAKAKENNVRSAIALAFITACAVRGGTTSVLSRMLYLVSEELKIPLPFKSGQQELDCITAISEAKMDGQFGKVGALKIPKFEIERAHKLLKDELGFLSEDFYDVSTY